MNQASPRLANCPQCGGPVEFKIGTSRATICAHCRCVVVRRGQDFAAVGRVADLVPTGSKIDVQSRGVLDGVAFEVLGRLQYEWTQGVWDEWFVAFADGRRGWLAEAQGQFYVTVEVAPRTVPPSDIAPGTSFFLEGLGRFVASDIKRAKIVGAQGELPDPVQLGETPLTADIEHEGGGFATIDYGSGAEPPKLYVGRRVPFEALHLGLKGGQPIPRAQLRDAEKLACPGCGAPLTVRVPTRCVRLVCGSCHRLLDCGHGPFQVIGLIEQTQTEPKIPLGAAGKLRDRDLVAIGWMVRSCVVAGVTYPWEEYLLWDEKAQSFAWLVESDGHWQLADPISVADVTALADAEYRGRRFRQISCVQATVQRVLGEFYWAVAVGDASTVADYVSPPEGLSSEWSAGELNWTHLRHLEAAEVAAAFAQARVADEPVVGVGTIQPWPHEATWRTALHWTLGGGIALLVLLLVFGLRAESVYIDQSFSPSDLAVTDSETGPAGERVHGYISPAFDIGPGALRVELTANVSNTWAYASGAIIVDATGDSAPFGVESSYYFGVDQGESWSEGNRTASVALRSPGEGTAIVRADLQWEPKHPPPSMRLRVSRDSFSGWQFVGSLTLLVVPLVLLAWRRSTFEKARWENSNLFDGSGD